MLLKTGVKEPRKISLGNQIRLKILQVLLRKCAFENFLLTLTAPILRKTQCYRC